MRGHMCQRARLEILAPGVRYHRDSTKILLFDMSLHMTLWQPDVLTHHSTLAYPCLSNPSRTTAIGIENDMSLKAVPFHSILAVDRLKMTYKNCSGKEDCDE